MKRRRRIRIRRPKTNDTNWAQALSETADIIKSMTEEIVKIKEDNDRLLLENYDLRHTDDEADE